MKKPSPSARPGNGNPLRDLYAPIIPNMAPPFEDYQGGIGAALVEGGLKCIVDPWEPMENGDAIGFYWGNEQAPVWTDVIDGNAHERLFFTISKGFIVRGDADPVFYRVTIPGQTPEDSRRLRLFVKLDRPGGYDDTPSIPGHSGLLYVVPQEIIDSGVGPIEADAGVDITIIHYEFMRKNDLIRLAWGRVIVEHTVQPEEVDTDIPIHIDRTVIENALDGQIDIAYQVVDVCNNYPDEREPWSAITTVQVDVGGNRLDAPQVLVNGFPAPQNVIDLEQLAGADVICRVYTNQTDHAIDDILQLTWVGTPAQGDSSVIVGPLEQTVQFIPFQYDFPIPYEYVEAIAKGRASVSYVRIRSGEEDRPSNNASVTVVGEIIPPARPSIIEAAGSVLDPDLNFYTVSVPYYPGRKPGDHIYIVFEGLDAANNPTGFDINAYVGAEPNGDPILRNVDKKEIKRLDGGSLTVYYWINSERKSLELQLSVGDGQPYLDKPDVIQANNDVLNPDDVNPSIGADVEAPYTGTLPNDIIVLRWRGSLISAPDQETPPLSSGSAGRPYPFIVPFQYVIGNLNGTVDVDYYLKRGVEPLRYSWVRELTIGQGGTQPERLPPIDDTDGVVINGELDLSILQGGFEIQVLPYDNMDVGDNITILWHADNGSPDYTYEDSVSGNGKDEPVPFTIPRNVLERSLDADVTITYTVVYFEGGDADSEEYNLRVVQQQAPRLPVPVIVEAHGTDILDPADALNGATVRIGTEARLKVGDAVTLYWTGRPGDGTVTKPLVPVTANDRVLDIPIDYRTVIANDGYSVVLEYTVKRANGDTEGPSPFAEYDVRSQIGSGTLKVMGARGIRGGYRASNSSRLISAFNSSTGQPLRAEWQYQGDEGWTAGTTWHDSHPEKLLRVRSSDDLVTLNSGNIIGNGIDTTVTGDAAFVAHRDVGDVVGWGKSTYGAAIPPTIITMDDIVEVSCTRSAYAGRRTNGHVVVWGMSAEGGLMTGVSPLDFVEVVGNGVAFAGIKVDGTVKAWGVAAKGGTVPAPIDGYRDIKHVVAAGEAFAALHGTGYIATWGTKTLGGELPDVLAGLNDFVEIIGSFGAFAAWRSNKRLVAWGSATYGGVVPDNIAAMTNIIELSCANAQAFVARRETGHVVAWGTANYGGTVPDLIAGLDDIVTVCSTWQSFAAIRDNGHVVAWGGTAATGGVVPDVIAGLNDIVQVAGSSKAFAALRKNGTVVAWGDATVGGDTAPVVGQLTNVQAIYENTHGFTALTSDGRVVTWGHPAGGGDSSGVQDSLEGEVSYLATPGSRGRALSATRWIAANTTLRLRAR
ncbi:hypothetical protein KV580_17870 [Pseudomonas chlororaphis]|nr:hypothetical protein [Pseudomonas chlororaphis]